MWCCPLLLLFLPPGRGAFPSPFLLLLPLPPLGLLHHTRSRSVPSPARRRNAGGASSASRGCDGPEQLAPRPGCDLGPRRIADCQTPGSRAQFLPVARGGKMRHLALLALLLAPVLGSTGQGSSTYSPYISLRFLGPCCPVRRSTGLRRSDAEAGRMFVSPFLVFFSFLFLSNLSFT